MGVAYSSLSASSFNLCQTRNLTRPKSLTRLDNCVSGIGTGFYSTPGDTAPSEVGLG
jgi:hypothetical protein